MNTPNQISMSIRRAFARDNHEAIAAEIKAHEIAMNAAVFAYKQAMENTAEKLMQQTQGDIESSAGA